MLNREAPFPQSTRGELISAHEQECHRIARELHTDIAGQLTLAALNVDELRADPSISAKPLLSSLYDRISDVLRAVLDLSRKIHPFNVEYLGLARALTKLCRDAGAKGDMTIKSSVEDVPLNLPLAASLRIFRFAQLALQNMQDRQAKTANVELKVGGGRILLRITDDGIGAAEGLGHAYMREQMLSLGGTFKLMSAPSRGMAIEASVPIDVSPTN
jgi:signal transduction histidine kinase